MNFQEVLNNFFTGDDNAGFKLDPSVFNFGISPEKLGFKFQFNLKGDSLLSFTQKLNKGYSNFLMITPTKLKDKYIEDNQISEEKEAKLTVERNTMILRKDNVTRTLNFGNDRVKNVKRSNFLDSVRKKKSLEEISSSLDKPYNCLSEGLMEIWNFLPGNNSKTLTKTPL